MRITNLLYLAHGDPTIRRQALFSLFTLFHHIGRDPHDLRVVIATDAPAFFRRWLPGVELIMERLEPDLVEHLMGETRYIHRVKAQVLRRTMHTFEGDCVMIDSDTWFTADPRPLFAKVDATHSLMHASEYPLAALAGYEQTHLRAIPAAFASRPFEIDGAPFAVPPTTMSWNSGVIGIAASNRGLVDHAVALVDQMRARVQNEIVEQYAFSAILGAHTTLVPAESAVRHYWERPVKSDYDHAIHAFLRRRFLQRGDLASLGHAALELASERVPVRPKPPTSLPLRALSKLARALDAHVLGV
jgi:hypothetical protein